MKLQYFNYDIGNSRDRMSGFLRQSLRDATPDTLVWSLHLTFSVFSLSPSSGSSPAVVKPNTRFSCHTRKDQGKLQHKEILFDGNANVSEAEKRGQFHAKHQILALFKLPPFKAKAMRDSDFILSLQARQAFCFTNPTFKVVDSLLSEVVAIKTEL